MARINSFLLATALFTALGFSACKTIPDPEPEPEPDPIVIEAETPSCIAPELLTREVIPAVIKRGFYITGTEDPPEYYTDPETGEVTELPRVVNETTVPYERVIEPERVVWKDIDGNEVTDVCLPEGETLESYIPSE